VRTKKKIKRRKKDKLGVTSQKINKDLLGQLAITPSGLRLIKKGAVRVEEGRTDYLIFPGVRKKKISVYICNTRLEGQGREDHTGKQLRAAMMAYQKENEGREKTGTMLA